jgi:hypothetical protein
MQNKKRRKDSRLALEEHLSQPCHETQLNQLILRRALYLGPLRSGKEIGKEPLGDGSDRRRSGSGGAFSWGGGDDEGKGFGAGPVLDGGASEGLEAEGVLLAVAARGEGR